MVQKLSDIETIVHRFIQRLSAEGISPQRVYLYGSWAQGNPREDSDIDVVVIAQDLGKFEPLERLEFLSRIAWHCGGPLEIIGYTPEEVQDKAGKSIFWDEICATGKVLYEAA